MLLSLVTGSHILRIIVRALHAFDPIKLKLTLTNKHSREATSHSASQCKHIRTIEGMPTQDASNRLTLLQNAEDELNSTNANHNRTSFGKNCEQTSVLFD